MLSKSRLTQLRALHQKKFRREQGLFIAEGEKLVLELLASSFRVKTVVALESWLSKNSRAVIKAAEDIPAKEEDLARISALVTPPPVLAVVEIPRYTLDPAQLTDGYTLFLDGIRDPGNMGTIIRIADWFGIRDVVCTPDSAEAWNPKVVQASMGSLTRVRVHEATAEDFFVSVKEAAEVKNIQLPVFGTFLDGENLYHEKFPAAGILVIGNEANGIRPETETYVTRRVTIPAWKVPGEEAGAESLNAAVATAIVCAEVRRNSKIQ